MNKRRKIQVELEGGKTLGLFRATATYRVGEVRIQRTASTMKPATAAYFAKCALLEAMTQQGIDPECVAAERMLMRTPEETADE